MARIEEIEEIKCPKCDSEDFSEKEIEPTGFAEYAIMSYKCNNCGTRFQVEYTAIEVKIIDDKKEDVEKGAQNIEKVKKIHFEVEYEYPVELDNEVILDMFSGQILDEASSISTDDIEIIEKKE